MSPYIPFTQEERDRAHHTDLTSLLCSQGEALKRSGAGLPGGLRSVPVLTGALPLRYLPAPPGYTLCLCTGEPGEVSIEDL